MFGKMRLLEGQEDSVAKRHKKMSAEELLEDLRLEFDRKLRERDAKIEQLQAEIEEVKEQNRDFAATFSDVMNAGFCDVPPEFFHMFSAKYGGEEFEKARRNGQGFWSYIG